MNTNFTLKIFASIGLISVTVLLTGFVSDVKDLLAGLEMLTTTAESINDTIITEQAISNQIETVRTQKKELETTLQELEYSNEEIKKILNTQFSSNDNTLLILQKTLQSIKRVKTLAKTILSGKSFNPEIVTAANTTESMRSLDEVKILLSQIIQNQNRDYEDRMLDRLKTKKDTMDRKISIHTAAQKISSPVQTSPSDVPFESFKKNEGDSSFNERLKKWWGK